MVQNIYIYLIIWFAAYTRLVLKFSHLEASCLSFLVLNKYTNKTSP